MLQEEKKAAYIKSVAFIPLINLLMKKLGKTDHSQWLQKNQIARNKFNKGGERPL